MVDVKYINAKIFAHSANDFGRWHPLAQHLTGVANLAGEFAENILWRDEVRLAGLLHDLGKYADRFQARLHGDDSGLDHWSQGAWVALSEHRSIAAALAIQGHHIGLQQGNQDALRRTNPVVLSQNHPLRLELSNSDVAELKNRAEADGLAFQKPKATVLSASNMEQAITSMLDVRMLFSCLVDADFLDTEAHFNGDAYGKCYREDGAKLDTKSARTALDNFMGSAIRNSSQADENVLQVREMLWQEVIDASSATTGRFTLTAPTGSGKTLAMLKFALEHAAANNLKRIVLVVPFLTIIEQTTKIYRAIFNDFPENFVLEHHSLAGSGAESSTSDSEDGKKNDAERQRRLLSENWDAPIILTTNVQLLESLFSNRPSSCRKLHNLMDSIILFDEAQSLPQHLAVPTLAALSHLSAAYRSSIVFATATQPAFDTLHKAVTKEAANGWKPDEIAPNHPAMFERLHRVKTQWPEDGKRTSWNALAEKLRKDAQALCVVNLKRHAAELLETLQDVDDVFHLSTNQCAEHRRTVLENVRARLKAGQSCRLISTQCVEAGVDLDFPLVYRALAPLESIAQAAGRCNREGRMNARNELGKVVVFEPDEEGGWRRCYPTHAYFQGAEKTRTLLKTHHGNLDISDPELYREYYKQLYDLTKPESQNKQLCEAIAARDFAEVARLYRLIDQDAIQILVPWQDKQDEFSALSGEAERAGISPGWMRRAQGMAVSIFRPKVGHPAESVLIPAKLRRGGVSDEWFILQDPRQKYYHAIRGLQLPQSELIFIA
ncbi:MAG: CRISPR-associated helicase Cas3' [Betaproteobacteria bacterium]|nr:CRISPR-associated helicase Cas3' [Betaproteobacteria bacterium]